MTKDVLHFRLGTATLCGAGGGRTTTDARYWVSAPALDGAPEVNCPACAELFGAEKSWADEMKEGLAELEALRASPKACAVADEWALNLRRPGRRRNTAPDLAAALDALEFATRESPLRKVKP